MKIIVILAISSLLASFTAFADNNDLENEWRSLDVKKTVLLILPHGKVVIELAPQFSPTHVKQFIKLVKSGHYNGNKFYRVIDGFVAQGGPDDGSPADKSVPILKMEGDFTTDKNWQFTKIQNNDLFAEQTGFKDGFSLAHNPSEKKAWLTHCPGVVAMARGNEADSASSHFYIVNGQATRYLDRIMTVFGRVVYGMNNIQAVTRTSVIEGDIPVNKKDFTPMLSMQMMSDVPKEKQILLQVQNTEHPAYSDMIEKRKKRENAFFYKKPPPVLDVCQTPVLSRIAK
ncbi:MULTISPECIES: peptidylprolyl isomerase [unclassified Colwellia]|uniref:peptidylprolyl isomerase n=2 Tax=Colwellia TaxID=28228 RepID=UPI0015F64340|nr:MULTISPECIES: peptidylprolyl isomerase [unclassified Colwellia]MBA6234452.1 peptidylprolyl isomerase [Colwellia sp. MB02u-7]MBA6236873.1 peptidylprolyl isomerase [Colwellia sp. MB02u-11]MBA6256184.1 peptidylprolyl isomerase [Colwellia sp. MB3u-28]MBA6260068.1 peptidylprolyl isomerase [Colwellia sp. MB3u-41]MBA6299987.1 peptidylprolyl isomerase [Colwellia sp. MB3u-22]